MGAPCAHRRVFGRRPRGPGEVPEAPSAPRSCLLQLSRPCIPVPTQTCRPHAGPSVLLHRLDLLQGKTGNFRSVLAGWPTVPGSPILSPLLPVFRPGFNCLWGGDPGPCLLMTEADVLSSATHGFMRTWLMVLVIISLYRWLPDSCFHRVPLIRASTPRCPQPALGTFTPLT